MSRFLGDRGGSAPLGRERSLAAANLELAVPAEIDAMRDDPERRERIAPGLIPGAGVEGGLIGDAGTWVVMRASSDSGGLTALARGLAAMAYRPGGVAYLGMCWTAADSPEAGRAAA